VTHGFRDQTNAPAKKTTVMLSPEQQTVLVNELRPFAGTSIDIPRFRR
jgi:hypothetical protein